MTISANDRARALSELPLQQVGATGGFVSGTMPSLREIWSRRQLLDLLIQRELKARYKDSSLGFLWSLARPLTQLLIYYVVIGTFLGAARAIPNFAIFIFCGLTAFTLFSEIVGGGTASIVTNAGLVKKIYLPREVFPLASVGSALFNFAIQLGILLVAAFLLGTITLGWHLMFFPLALAVLLIYAIGLALILSAANVYLRDIGYLVEVVLLLMMWASPIVYSWNQVSMSIPAWLGEVYLANPMTLSVLGFQETFWQHGQGASPDGLVVRLLVAGVIGLVFMWLSHRIFSRVAGNFAQEL